MPLTAPLKPLDIHNFTTTQQSLLTAELEAETSQTLTAASTLPPVTLQRAGLALLNLRLSNQRTGLGGRTVLELELDPAFAGLSSPSGARKGTGKGGGKGGKGAADGTRLPEHGLRVGDIVGIRQQVGGSAKKREKQDVERKGVEGVVVKVVAGMLGVALDKERDEAVEGIQGGRLWIVKLANDVTYRRMNQTMRTLQTLPTTSHTPLMRVLFGQTQPTPVPPSDPNTSPTIEWINPSLNPSQKRSILFSLSSPEIALIHGPPGTGKTHTLIELILQLLKQKPTGARILVCGPSNISVDNIVERLAPHKVPMVRLGHPARLLPSVLNHSLDVLTKTSDAAALVQDIRNELDAKQSSIKKTRSGGERRGIYAEIKDLRKEYRERERGCVDDLVRGSKVVLATLHGSGGGQLTHKGAPEFDCVVVDEAAQALEAQCWVPLVKARKAVLAGDHLQLPPTVKSVGSGKVPAASQKSEMQTPAKDEAESKSTLATKEPKTPAEDPATPPTTLETTLFDRLLTLHGPTIKTMLTTQYRMHASIMAFPSQALYSNKLEAHHSVASHLLVDLPYPEAEKVRETDDSKAPLVFYDTQGGEFQEMAEELEDERGASGASGKSGGGGKGDGSDKKKHKKATSLLSDSKSNPLEARLAARHVRALVEEAGVRPSDIAVIAPYNAQVSLLASLLKNFGDDGGSEQSKYADLEIGSVDGFQGREKEAVVLSLVRSNDAREVGFLGEKRRLNVAMTRPRRHLCVIGDSETVSRGSTFLKQWMQHLEQHADLRYPDPADVLGEG
ncbi:MAG: hypothetical protein M1831_007020 [Alyxoria varia]|nr:MAG: hypothetical protein M1831_007020 [Alyxoria varia]